MENRKACAGLCDKLNSGLCANFCLLTEEQRISLSDKKIGANNGINVSNVEPTSFQKVRSFCSVFLFNCCPFGVLLDMKMFSHLEINSIFSVSSEFYAASSCADKRLNKHTMFFTVFACKSNGEIEAIHNCSSLSVASRISDLIVKEYPNLDSTKIFW